jgi:hypothetical protein
VAALAALVLLTHCGGVDVQEQASEEPRPQAPATVEQGLATTYTFPASADARVEESFPTRNFGVLGTLGVDLSPRLESSLRFSLRGLTGTVTRATLRLYASDGTTNGPRVFLDTGSFWTEGGVTWGTRPVPGGAPLADKGAISSGTWVEYDVTSGVSGDGMLDLVLVSDSSDGTTFASREHAREDLRPQLVVTVTGETPLPMACMPRTELHRRTTNAWQDGSVSQSEPERNSGTASTLLVDGSPFLESYLTFEIPTYDLTVRDARLWLHAIDDTSDGPLLYRASDTWSEEDLTWSSRPGLSEQPIGNLGAITPDSWVSYDLTRVVTEHGDYSFALLPESSNGVSFDSNEGGSALELEPFVSVTLESPPFCSYRGAGGGLTAWARQYGGVGAEELEALAPHPAGGFVAVGRFGNATFPNPGEGLALARYSAEGEALWTRVVITRNVWATRVVLTSLGNILVVGRYEGSPDLGTGPLPFVLPEQEGLFLAKFSPTGSSVWARGFVVRSDPEQPEARLYPNAVATDAQGSLLVTGLFSGRMDLGGGVLASNATSTSAPWWFTGGFLAKFSWEGRHLWSRALQRGGDDEEPSSWGSAVSTDGAGNVLVGGAASRWTDLGDGPLGVSAPFVAKYSPSGSLLWKRVFRGAYGEVVGVQPQGSHRIAFSGNIGGPFTFGGYAYSGGNPDDGWPAPPNTSGFIGAMSDTGADVWIRSVGSGYTLWLDELAVGEDGALTVSGRGENVFNPGGGPLGYVSPFNYELRRSFVARYWADGQHAWSRAFDQALTFDLAPQPGGAVLLGATLSGTPQLEGETFTPRGDSDLLYLRLQP